VGGVGSVHELTRIVEDTLNRKGEVGILRKTPTENDDGIRLVTAVRDESPRSTAVQISKFPGYEVSKEVKPITEFLDSLVRLSPNLGKYRDKIFLLDRSKDTKELPKEQRTVLPKEVPESAEVINIRRADGQSIVSDRDLLDLKTLLARVANPNSTIKLLTFIESNPILSLAKK
jgi:hypothetical protein